MTFTTRDAGTTWRAEYKTYGGVETAFTQPTLSANGTLGGSSFAVASDAYLSGFEAYKAVDGSNFPNRWVGAQTATGWFTFYNPAKLKVSNLAITNGTDGYAITGYSIYGSNNNTDWTFMYSGTNSNTTNGATWNITIPENNRDLYNYYKIAITNTNGYTVIVELTITATYIAI